MRSAYVVAFSLVLALGCAQSYSATQAPAPSDVQVQTQRQLAESQIRLEESQRQLADTQRQLAESQRAEKDRAEKERSRDERVESEHAANERGMLLWTIVLAIGTIALVGVGGAQLWMFFRQLKLTRAAMVDSTKAANAAKTSADSQIDSERAYVKMRRMSNPA